MDVFPTALIYSYPPKADAGSSSALSGQESQSVRIRA